MSSLYKQIIIDHYKNPRNWGSCTECNHSHTEHNSSCGDSIFVSVLTDDKDKVIDIKFTGEGCAISLAGASILYEKLIGKSVQEVMNFPEAEMLKLISMRESSGRLKCGLIGLKAIQNALNVKEE